MQIIVQSAASCFAVSLNQESTVADLKVAIEDQEFLPAGKLQSMTGCVDYICHRHTCKLSLSPSLLKFLLFLTWKNFNRFFFTLFFFRCSTHRQGRPRLG